MFPSFSFLFFSFFFLWAILLNKNLGIAVGYGDYPDLSRVEKVLVIKLRHLGDVLLTAPVFTHLKAALPQARIDAYIYEEAAPMLDLHPSINRLIGHNRGWKKLSWFKRLWKEVGLLWQLRKNRYDLVINLTEGDRGTLVARVSKAKLRVGFVPKGRWQKKVYTHVIKHGPHVRHTVEKQLDALRRIGIFPDGERSVIWNIPENVMDKMRRQMGDFPFVLVHPSSRWKFKCYPVDKMRACIKSLCELGHRVVLTSGPDLEEVAMVQGIAHGLQVEVLAGKTSLHELGALICLSQVLLCVDSVPLHMASALKKPVVVLFGPTSEITWGPWENPHATVLTTPLSCRPCYQDGCGGSKHSDCLARIPVRQVVEAVESYYNAYQG